MRRPRRNHTASFKAKVAVAVAALKDDKTLLDKIITRLMRMLTGLGYLVEEQGMTYLADIDIDNPLMPLQAASCTYRIALGPRPGQKARACAPAGPDTRPPLRTP